MSLMPLTVACVLKSGGDFNVEHVAALRDAVAKHIGREHRFVCLSDVPVPCIRIPLRHRWPGWWAKMELYDRERLPGPVLYLDLDTVLFRPFGDMLDGHVFTAVKDWWLPGINAGVMAWDTDLSLLYHRFAEDPAGWMASAQTPECWVDQGLIWRWSPVPISFWQDRFPDRLVSWKATCKEQIENIPAAASIVCFHGKPRPWETPLWRL